MPKKDADAPRDLFPTEEEIAQLAYELCFVTRRSCPAGHGYLQLAEQELLDRAARRVLRPTSRPRRR